METRSDEEGKLPISLEGFLTRQYHEPKDIDAAEHEEKHRRYEALYARRLRAKYFSKKAVDGGDIYDHETTIDNEVIKSSRWPCTRSFADPIKYLEERNQSSCETETTGTPKQKLTPKKSS